MSSPLTKKIILTPNIYELFMSYKFQAPGRTFRNGSYPRWTSLNKNDYTNEDQHFYSHDNAYTNNDGELYILTKASNTDIIAFDEVTKKNVRATKH